MVLRVLVSDQHPTGQPELLAGGRSGPPGTALGWRDRNE